MKKEKAAILVALLIGIAGVLVCLLVLLVQKDNTSVQKADAGDNPEMMTISEKETEQSEEVPESKQAENEGEFKDEDSWTLDSLRNGLKTAIEYDKQFRAYVPSKEEAEKAIRDYGVMQREKYSNPETEAIESKIEEEFGIFAANLGEVEAATAEDVYRAVSYMYETYPQMKGTLTNICIGNFPVEKAANVAVTQRSTFIIHEEVGQLPYVVKAEIVLNAAKFTNREKMLAECETQISTGHWPKNSDISSIVVHELGHHLLDVIVMEHFGLKDAYYISKENEEAYIQFSTDMLAVNQTVAKGIMQEAYTLWMEEYGHMGTEEDFRGSISGYALGFQPDGGISYGETFAEAVADVYLNGEEASDGAKAIVEVSNERLEKMQ